MDVVNVLAMLVIKSTQRIRIIVQVRTVELIEKGKEFHFRYQRMFNNETLPTKM